MDDNLKTIGSATLSARRNGFRRFLWMFKSSEFGEIHKRSMDND